MVTGCSSLRHPPKKSTRADGSVTRLPARHYRSDRRVSDLVAVGLCSTRICLECPSCWQEVPLPPDVGSAPLQDPDSDPGEKRHVKEPETVHPGASDSKRCTPTRLGPPSSPFLASLAVRNEQRPCPSGRNGARVVRGRVGNRRAGRRVVSLLLMLCLRLPLLDRSSNCLRLRSVSVALTSGPWRRV